MVIQKNFIRFSSVCCFITVITTLGIHAFFPDPPAGFDERILLFRNTTYLVNRWWVIVHCLLVIVAMWGFALLLFKKNARTYRFRLFVFLRVWHCRDHPANDGAVLYKCFEGTISNAATDAVIRDGLKITLASAGQLTAPLFGVFILMFGLGSLCYGLSLIKTKGFSKLLSILFIISGIVSFIVLGNNFWKIPAIDGAIEKYSYSFTPLLRALTGVWLWKNSNDLQKPLMTTA